MSGHGGSPLGGTLRRQLTGIADFLPTTGSMSGACAAALAAALGGCVGVVSHHPSLPSHSSTRCRSHAEVDEGAAGAGAGAGAGAAAEPVLEGLLQPAAEVYDFRIAGAFALCALADLGFPPLSLLPRVLRLPAAAPSAQA